MKVTKLRANLEVDFEPYNLIEISRARLLHNYDHLKSFSSGEVLPVIKSNGYGHGIQQVAQVLSEKNPPYLVVDSYLEALAVREVVKTPVLVLKPILPQNIPMLQFKDIALAVQTVEELQALKNAKAKVNVHLEVDSGMRRAGLDPRELDDALQIIKKTKRLKLDGIMSHLADADNPTDSTYSNKQVALFDKIIEKVKEAGFNPPLIHLSQTAGAPKVRSKYANAIRPGIGLYGVNPYSPSDPQYDSLDKLQPIMRLTSRIAKVRELKPGARISYNGMYRVPKDMRVATLPIGYYEGVKRELSNKARLTSEHGEHRILGRICMNYTMIDVTGKDIYEGDLVTVISHNKKDPNSVQQLCDRFHFFNYEFITKLDASLSREVVDDFSE